MYAKRKILAYPFLTRIICFIMVVSMIPFFKIDAQAATLRYQYVWLLSKPGISYTYDGKNAPVAYSSYQKNKK